VAKAEPDEFIEHLLDQLRPWGPVLAKRMFGGYGLFRGSLMFALVSDDTLYFRTDDENRPDFEEAGMPPFRYRRKEQLVALAYHEVPADLLEDREKLALWAGNAFAAASRRQEARAKSKPKSKPLKRKG